MPAPPIYHSPGSLVSNNTRLHKQGDVGECSCGPGYFHHRKCPSYLVYDPAFGWMDRSKYFGLNNPVAKKKTLERPRSLRFLVLKILNLIFGKK